MRNWKKYSSVARDGEKTVYCSKGNHSVYYGDAFISFKPSKLIWCKECKNTYYEVKPTLFNTDTQEVDPMKCDKNPLNNLVEMPEAPTDEQLMLWLTSMGDDRYSFYSGRMMQGISRQAKKEGWISPKQKAVALAHYLQDAAHINPLTKKTWGHEWQKNTCKWCNASKDGLTEKVEQSEQQLVDDYSFEQLIWPVELEIAKNDEHGRIYVTCTRCNGCGLHSYNMRDGSMCWGCQGTGVMLDPLMTQPQIKFIRELFKSVKHKMTIDEQEELIEIMKGAINKTKRVNKFWASQTIEKLKNLQTERSAS